MLDAPSVRASCKDRELGESIVQAIVAGNSMVKNKTRHTCIHVYVHVRRCSGLDVHSMK